MAVPCGTSDAGERQKENNMRLIISQGSVKREINGPFAMCCSVSYLDKLIQELQFAHAGMAGTGITSGWFRVDPSHPANPSSAGPPLPWDDLKASSAAES